MVRNNSGGTGYAPRHELSILDEEGHGPCRTQEACCMEVRCEGCNKLFRVSDDKITGMGIKFACSKCGAAVKITSEALEQYKLSREAVSALASFEPKPRKQPSAEFSKVQESEVEVWKSGDASPDDAVHPDFDLSDPASAAAAMQQEEQPPAFVMPETAADPAPAAAAKPVSPPAAPRTPAPASAQPVRPAAAAPKPAPQAVPQSASSTQPVQPKVTPRPAAPVRPAAEAEVKKPATPPVRPAAPRPAQPAVVVSASQPATGSSAGMKILIAVVAVIVLAAGAYFAKPFFSGSSRTSFDIGKEVTPEGLQIANASGGVDPVSGDLIISGTIENSTDKARPAWYVVVDLLDAKGTVLSQAKLVSGKYFYTRRDMDILAKRGTNIQELKAKQLQDQGIVIPARGSVTFEIRVLEPPIGVANFNASLHPFDPVKLYKEMSEEQK